jgi:hypothetical protein
MEYISLRWSNFPVCGSYHDFFDRGLLQCCVMFCRSSFVLFSFVHCIVWPSMNYSFWLLLWWLQIFLDVLLHSMFLFRVIQAIRANIFTRGNKLGVRIRVLTSYVITYNTHLSLSMIGLFSHFNTATKYKRRDIQNKANYFSFVIVS